MLNRSQIIAMRQATATATQFASIPVQEHNKPNPERALRKKKAIRERDLMRPFKDAYAKECFDGCDMEYLMQHNKKGTVVSVRIKGNRWAEFRLKTTGDSEACMNQLQQIPLHVKALKSLFETINDDVTIVKRPE